MFMLFRVKFLGSEPTVEWAKGTVKLKANDWLAEIRLSYKIIQDRLLNLPREENQQWQKQMVLF